MEKINKEGKRYYLHKNKEFISVTSLVNTYYISKGLEIWKATTPLEEQNKISKASLEIGNSFHLNVENYFKKKEHTLKEYELNFLKGLNLDTPKLEVPFTFSKDGKGYAGTIDCLTVFQNEVVILDWKTSKKKKYASGMFNYFLQLSAYSKAFKVDSSYIVVNDYSKETFSLWKLDKELIDFFYGYFIKMLVSFYEGSDYFNQEVFEKEAKGLKIKEYKL